MSVKDEPVSQSGEKQQNTIADVAAAAGDRCRAAIALGWYPELRDALGHPVLPASARGIHTRCIGPRDGHRQHEGVGLPQFAVYQRFHWFTRDRRCYETNRDDTEAWEQ